MQKIYQNRYEKLVTHYKNNMESGYCEKHHIIPKCMGGTDELENLVTNDQILIFDVRKVSEFQSEHLIDATNVPLNVLHKSYDQFPKNKPFVLHCAGGYRSMIAASMLKQNGYDMLVDVIGGFKEIQKILNNEL
jgi:rhodanese-related sulfurtransferase